MNLETIHSSETDTIKCRDKAGEVKRMPRRRLSFLWKGLEIMRKAKVDSCFPKIHKTKNGNQNTIG